MKNFIKARAVIIHDGKMFLTKDTVSGKFMTPGGTLEQGETIRQTLFREIQEELGVIPQIERCLGYKEYMNREGDITLQFLFLLKNTHDFFSIDKEQCSHGYEWSDEGFYDIGELKHQNAPIPEDLEEILEAALYGKEYQILM